jgi:AAA15 family ATPase/GTPase
MFESIKIRNFRVITKLELDDLGQVNLLVGQNGCGKTTFLEAVFFLIGATNPMLPVNVNIFRGLTFFSNKLWHTYFHNMDPNIPIEIGGRVHDTKEEQNLLIRPRSKRSQPIAAHVPSLSYARGDSETMFEVDGLELEYESSGDPTSKTKSAVFFKDGNIASEGSKERAIRGIFVSPCIYDWKDRFSEIQRKKQVPEVIFLLKEIEPHLSDLRLNEVGLLLADIGPPELIPVNLMGGGIVKFLSIALAMLDCKNGMVLIDEIENGLHHSAQKTIWKAIFNWAEKLNVQVFATTHSDESVRAFSNTLDEVLFKADAKLFRIERKDGTFRAVEYTKDVLAESLDSRWEVR